MTALVSVILILRVFSLINGLSPYTPLVEPHSYEDFVRPREALVTEDVGELICPEGWTATGDYNGRCIRRFTFEEGIASSRRRGARVKTLSEINNAEDIFAGTPVRSYLRSADGSWNEAMRRCSAYNATLAVIKNAEDAEIISNVVGNDACWVGLRKYSSVRSASGWIWVDSSESLGNDDFVDWGPELSLIWKLVPPEEKCVGTSPEGWIGKACWGLNSRLDCFVCDSKIHAEGLARKLNPDEANFFTPANRYSVGHDFLNPDSTWAELAHKYDILEGAEAPTMRFSDTQNSEYRDDTLEENNIDPEEFRKTVAIAPSLMEEIRRNQEIKEPTDTPDIVLPGSFDTQEPRPELIPDTDAASQRQQQENNENPFDLPVLNEFDEDESPIDIIPSTETQQEPPQEPPLEPSQETPQEMPQDIPAEIETETPTEIETEINPEVDNNFPQIEVIDNEIEIVFEPVEEEENLPTDMGGNVEFLAPTEEEEHHNKPSKDDSQPPPPQYNLLSPNRIIVIVIICALSFFVAFALLVHFGTGWYFKRKTAPQTVQEPLQNTINPTES